MSAAKRLAAVAYLSGFHPDGDSWKSTRVRVFEPGAPLSDVWDWYESMNGACDRVELVTAEEPPRGGARGDA